MKFKSIAQVEINGAMWEIGYGHAGVTKGKTNDGICRYDKRRIVINRGATCCLLDVLAHELIHACLPDIHEEAVASTATIIANVYNQFPTQPSRSRR